MKFFKDLQIESKSGSHKIIDARSSERFHGLVDEPRKGLRRGTIPNSLNLPFEHVMSGTRMKPTSELKIIMKPVIHEMDQVTFSCGSGITACILALAADLAGYQQLSIYDGSWTEWGSLTS